MSPEQTDWHVIYHEQLERRMGRMEERLEGMDGKLDGITTTLAENRGEKAVRTVAGSYVIPGIVGLAMAYVGRKLGL